MQKIALTSLLPTGIRLRKGKKFDSIIVQTRKNVIDAEGKEHQVKDFRTIKLSEPNATTEAKYVEAFKEALEEAKKEKLLAIQHIAVHGVESISAPKQRGVATLGEVYDLVFKSRWQGTPQERGVVIYAQDLFAFFPKVFSSNLIYFIKGSGFPFPMFIYLIFALLL